MKIFSILKKAVAHFKNLLIKSDRSGCKQNSHKRIVFEKKCMEFFLKKNLPERGEIYGPVLVDGTWDNPNYWFRLNMFLNAITINREQCLGYTGKYSAGLVKKTFKRLGIKHIKFNQNPPIKKSILQKAFEIKNSDEFLKLQFPHEFPAGYAYDYILKKQAVGVPNFKARSFRKAISDVFVSIANAERIINERKPSLIILSHMLGCPATALAWLGVKKKIPVCVLYGDFGCFRFIKLDKTDDIFLGQSRPKPQDIAELSLEQKEKLKVVGLECIKKRLNGECNDIGSLTAFGKKTNSWNKLRLCQEFHWSDKKPIVTIYTATWYDWPHIYGMKNFCDMKDWVDSMFHVIKKCPDFQWLIRPHPLESWYGKLSITDYIKNMDAPHIRLLPNGVNGKNILDITNGVVTYHGTIGLEAAVLGKPVLLADRGWYHDMEIAKYSESREDFFNSLRSGDWLNGTSAQSEDRAKLIAGFHFARPAWHNGWSLDDDSLQFALYDKIPDMINKYKSEIELEILSIAKWWDSSSSCYNVWKIMESMDYTS